MTTLNDAVRWRFCIAFNGTVTRGSIVKKERKIASENWERTRGIITVLKRSRNMSRRIGGT